MRRELGRQLAIQRKAVGLVQRELGTLVGYSRIAIANAETGAAVTSRRLWQGADAALGTGDLFARATSASRPTSVPRPRPVPRSWYPLTWGS